MQTSVKREFESNPESTMPVGIEAIPGICGGDPLVAGTRIAVWTLEQARRLGATVEQILDEYPTLRLQDIHNAWEDAAAHRDEIDRQIHENEVA